MKKYNKTLFATLFSNINLSVLTIINAIIFVPLMNLYGLSIYWLGLLIGLNFLIQMIADIILTLLIDKYGIKPFVLLASLFSFLGLIIYFLVPYLFNSNIKCGIIISTIIFAFSGGMLEVTLSPIIDNLPDEFDKKEKLLSLLHSLYGYGQVLVIIVSSIVLFIFGEQYWNFIPLIFSVVPLVSFILFINAPIEQKPYETSKLSIKILLNKFCIVALLTIMFGAGVEVLLNHFISSFLTIEFEINKQIADLFGLGIFALVFAISRSYFGKNADKINIHKILCIMSFLTLVIYLLIGISSSKYITLILLYSSAITVSMLWPGTLIISSRYFPTAGAWLFSLLAIFGDLGASFFPYIGGVVSNSTSIKNMFLIFSFLPLITFILHLTLYAIKRKKHYN